MPPCPGEESGASLEGCGDANKLLKLLEEIRELIFKFTISL
jgi:hypothetical protein